MNTNNSTNHLSDRAYLAQIVRYFAVFFLACPCEGEQFSVISSAAWLLVAALVWYLSGIACKRFTHKSNS